MAPPDATDVGAATSGDFDTDFSKMGIYVDGRTKNEMGELLKTKTLGEVTARDMYNFSCMHYLDDEPMNAAAEFFGLTTTSSSSSSSSSPSHKILDFGAGFAGDARVMCAEYPGCEITCVEVQPHIHEAAKHFTEMLRSTSTGGDDAAANDGCGPKHVSDRCIHQCVDVFESPIEGAPFDHLFCVLVILHIPNRDKLWGALAAAVKPGGTIYVEDYFAAKPLTDQDKAQLAGPVACPYLPSQEEYMATLAGAGFVDVEWEVMNDRWLPFVDSRLKKFRAAGERNERVHGAALTAELDLFYSTVHELFTRGNLGGVRIKAKRAAV